MLDCTGYRKLKEAVINDQKRSPRFHNYDAKLDWIEERAKAYANLTKMTPEQVLDIWESRRNYWYMNYYQECNQPLPKDQTNTRIFDTRKDFLEAIGDAGFLCPRCGGISKSPYECDTGNDMEPGKVCDWKSFGLFRTLGKGVTIIIIDELIIGHIFMPVAFISELDLKKEEVDDDACNKTP